MPCAGDLSCGEEVACIPEEAKSDPARMTKGRFACWEKVDGPQGKRADKTHHPFAMGGKSSSLRRTRLLHDRAISPLEALQPLVSRAGVVGVQAHDHQEADGALAGISWVF